MCSDFALQERILKENQDAHDHFAPQHDAVCSYIARTPCREFYSRLILSLSRWDERKEDNCAVLELGCGTGTWAPLFQHAQEFTGIDISPKMIAAAQKKYQDPTRIFHCGEVAAFLNNEIARGKKYDVIVSSSFLHHLYDIDNLVGLIGQVLRKGGVYAAIHEPIKPLLPSEYTHPLGKRVDTHLSYLLGYDCDLPDNPPLRRTAQTLKAMIPFKDTIKKVLGMKASSQIQPETISYVDYKLSDGQLFHPVIFANKSYEGLQINFDIYSYYAFPEIGRFFGEISNYFYVTFTKDG